MVREGLGRGGPKVRESRGPRLPFLGVQKMKMSLPPKNCFRRRRIFLCRPHTTIQKVQLIFPFSEAAMDTAPTDASRQYTMAPANDAPQGNSADGAYSVSSLTAVVKAPPAKGKPTSAKLQRVAWSPQVRFCCPLCLALAKKPPSSTPSPSLFSSLRPPATKEDECLKRIMANTKLSSRIPWSVLANWLSKYPARRRRTFAGGEGRQQHKDKLPHTRTLAHLGFLIPFLCLRAKVERDPAGQERPGVDERRGRPPARLPEGEWQQVARLRQVRECRPKRPGGPSRVEEAKQSAHLFDLPHKTSSSQAGPTTTARTVSRRSRARRRRAGPTRPTRLRPLPTWRRRTRFRGGTLPPMACPECPGTADTPWTASPTLSWWRPSSPPSTR